MRRSIYFLVSLLIAIGNATAQGTTPTPDEDAFLTAIHQKNPEAKVKALDSFLRKFPDSQLKERTLEILIEAYRETQSLKMGPALDELLTLNPDNLFGLTLKAESMCDLEPRPGFCEALEADTANRGLRSLTVATRPPDMSEEDFMRRKAHASFAFHRILGHQALLHRDYQSAQVHLSTAEQLNPMDFGCVYALALAYMNAEPPNKVQGLFFIARATSLVQRSSQKQLLDYGRAQYAKYHGSAAGWSELLALAKASPTTPAGFTITPADKTP